LADRIINTIGAEQRADRRRVTRARLGLVAAVVVGVLVGIVGTNLIGGGGSERPTGVEVAFPALPAGLEAAASIVERPWGSGIWFDASGLEPGQLYAAWLERPGGTRVAAGTFRPGDDGRVRCYFTAGLDVAGTAALGVSDQTGSTVLRATVT
jgi:hypothetical protein